MQRITLRFCWMLYLTYNCIVKLLSLTLQDKHTKTAPLSPLEKCFSLFKIYIPYSPSLNLPKMPYNLFQDLVHFFYWTSHNIFPRQPFQIIQQYKIWLINLDFLSSHQWYNVISSFARRALDPTLFVHVCRLQKWYHSKQNIIM